MLEVLRNLSAAGAGRRGVVVPGRVSAEVALPRPHLMKATRIKFGETHKRMGFQ